MLLAIVAGAVTPLVINYREAEALFSSWLGNEPKMLVKLSIWLPNVNADNCFVMVRRFPTPFNPTKNGLTELVYQGIHRPGTIIEVKNMLFAYVAKYRTDESTGKYLVDYYEPQEYFIAIACAKGGKTVFKWGRIVEVYPRSIIHTETIRVSEKENQTNQISSVKQVASIDDAREIDGGSGANILKCNIQIVYEDYSHKVGYCKTWVKGPRLYSIDGVWTSFAIYSPPEYSKPSAVYIEAYYDSDYGLILRSENEVQWKSAGKKLTPSGVTASTSPLTGYYSDQVYFYVEYRYEYWAGCYVPEGPCDKVWLLYPVEVWDVERSAESPSLFPYDVRPYSPPTPPIYANPASGSRTISFIRYSGEVKEYDIGIASITIEFSYAGVWKVSLTVNFYKAVRDDSQYTTPAVKVYSSRCYWWWYKDNDETTYEVLFAPRQC
jgi:hypothetical protein